MNRGLQSQSYTLHISRNEVDTNLLHEASSFRVRDDVLAILEEIVMYAFQQLVYYLTKVGRPFPNLCC